MVAPWTWDGQVRVQVANIAPQVAGQVVELHALDDGFVQKGDPLYVIDKVNFKVALDMANADVTAKKADLGVKQNENAGVTRGISDQNATVSTQGLPSVQAVYTWVRLVQRIPVRVRIDTVPDAITLAAGLTATIVVTPAASGTHPAWYDVRHHLESLLAYR